MVEDSSKEPIGYKGSTTSSATMHRGETAGQKVREGWNDFKQKVKQKWSQVTDKDLDTWQSADRNAFVGGLHGKVGGDRTMIERDIDGYARDTKYDWR